MTDITDFLARVSWPLVSRVLAALGLGTVTYAGADTALTGALTAAKNAFVGMGADILQLMAIAGVFDAMAIMSGGIVSGLSWMVLKRFALQVGTA